MAKTRTETSYTSRPETYSYDQDLVRLAPLAFDLLGDDYTLSSGSDGDTNTTANTLTSALSDFTTDGILVGDVVEIDFAGGEMLCRVTAVTSATELAIARVGSISGTGATIPAETLRDFRIRTFDFYREAAQREIAVARLKLDDPNTPLTADTGDDADEVWRQRDIRDAEAHLALSDLFASRAAFANDDDTYQKKADEHKERYDRYFASMSVILSKGGATTPTEIKRGSVQTLTRG